jgi:hypothetical protein
MNILDCPICQKPLILYNDYYIKEYSCLYCRHRKIYIIWWDENKWKISIEKNQEWHTVSNFHQTNKHFYMKDSLSVVFNYNINFNDAYKTLIFYIENPAFL